MFNLFRSREKSVRYLLGAILVVISLSMLIYLIPGGAGGGSGENQNVVATVGGQKIMVADVERQIQNTVGGQANIPRTVLASYVPAFVNQLVGQYALAYKAKELGLSVSDAELANDIQSLMASQMGGKFDQTVYAQLIEQRFNWTVPQWENWMRTNILAARYQSVARQALIVSDEEARQEFEKENAKVALQYLAFRPKDFAAKVSQDPAVVKAWFEKNRSFFQTPEKRSFDLVAGVATDFAQNVKISDQELQRAYQENIDSYRTAERVQARHILIKTTDVPKDQIPQLRAKAEDILKQLKAGADFATLATKYSQDPGSAAKGGDLGWLVKGQTVPEFEKAAFSLKPKELSGLITTEYGFHIIQVLDHQQAHVQPFEEVKGQLLADAQKDRGGQDMEKAMNDARSEAARNPSQIQEIAKKYGLKFFKVDQASTGSILPELGTQPDMFSTIFTEAKGQVSPVVSFDNVGKAGFAVVTDIFPAHNATFEDAQKDVVSRYTISQSSQLANDAAKAAAAKAKQGESLESIAKAVGGELKTASAFTINGAAEGIGPASGLSAAFNSATKVGDSFGPVTIAGAQFVCKVTEKTPADMSQFAQNREKMIETVKGKKVNVQDELFKDSVVTSLKQRGVVKLNGSAIERLIASYKS